MSNWKYLPFVLASFVLIYVWVTNPSLNSYSLQLFAISTMLFFGLRFKHNRQRLLSALPHPSTSELIPLTLMFILLVATTGNTHSWLYPLTYLYLFLIAFALDEVPALVVAFGVLVLQYALLQSFTPQEMIILVNIPLITGIMIFAKKQLSASQQEAQKLAHTTRDALTLETYISEFLIPKSEVISNLGQPTTELEKTMHSQIELLVSESKKILNKLEQNT